VNELWPRFTKENPCPGCGHWDWTCRHGDYGYICMRNTAGKPQRDGGFFFRSDEKVVKPLKAPPRRPVAINAGKIMAAWKQRTFVDRLTDFSAKLGVTYDSLIGLDASWAPEHDAWAFPMRNGNGDTVGIRLRNEQGEKWAVRGSRAGIFSPNTAVPIQRVVYLPEGPTDTAALLSLGLYAIGRPSCNTGGEQLKEWLGTLGIHRAVIVADNDEMKRLGPSEARPGIEGAKKLKKELGISSVIWIPPSPFKDVREFLRNGGTKSIIEADLKNRVWSKE
jgi:hypothetical protein